VADRLRRACTTPHHHFWPDDVSLLDDSLFQRSMITTRNVTDVYLLGVAVRHHGRLATFARSIPLQAVHESGPRNLVVLGRG
jgi:hypothetical protein